MNGVWHCLRNVVGRMPLFQDADGVEKDDQQTGNHDDAHAELEEAAQIDGCNDLSSFVRIILPLSMASIATFALFFAVGHWNAYFNTMLYITDSRKWTLPVLVKTMVMDSSGTGYGAATSISSDTKAVPQDTIKMSAIVLSMLPILVLYPFLQKYFVKGVMIGAVKG